MWFLTLIVRNLQRRPLRSLLTLTAIAVAAGTVVTLVGISSGFEQSFLALYKRLGIDLVVNRAGGVQLLNTHVREDLGNKLKEISGVKEVIPSLADYTTLPDFRDYPVVVQGWEAGSSPITSLHRIKGDVLTPGRKEIMIGKILAANLNKDIGGTINLYENNPYTVVGIFQSNNVLENGMVVIDLHELQGLTDRKDKVNGFGIKVTEPRNQLLIDQVAGRIEALGGGLKATASTDLTSMMNELQLAKAMAWLTSSVALLIGGFSMMNTMLMAVQERTREIGILRALGWKRRRVLGMILLEAVVLSIAGACVGSVGALVLTKVLTRLPPVNGMIEGDVSPELVVLTFVIAVGMGLVCGAMPAWRASRLLPTVALRHE
jgi:putative ABC transport system permease protein